MKIDTIQTSFVGGEFAPSLFGRTDVSQYANACATVENWLIRPYGSLISTPGTEYITECKTGGTTSIVRLIQFIFSRTDSYIIEMGVGYFRFFTNGAVVVSTGTTPYEVAHTYTASELFDVQFSQVNDVIYLAHKDHRVQKLVRYAAANWALEDFNFIGGPFLDDNTGTITIACNATSGTGATLTLSATTSTIQFVPSSSSTVLGSINSYWKVGAAITDSTTGLDVQGYVKITNVVSPSVATVSVIQTLASTAATTSWAEGAWSSVNGWPARVTFHQQRLFLARTDEEPQKVWGSKSFIYDDFAVNGGEDDDAINIQLASNESNDIKWIVSGSDLIAGTYGGEFIIKAGDDSPLTPSNTNVKKQTSWGSEDIVPKKIGNFFYYVQRFSKKLRELFYFWDLDSYKSVDKTILSPHVAGDGFIDMSYQQNPDTVLWCVCSNGTIATMTREIDQEVQGWTRQTTSGLYESIATIPSQSESHDEVWVVVKRTVNGSSKRYIERFKSQEIPDRQDQCWYVHSGLNYDAFYETSATPTVTNISISATAGTSVVVTSNTAYFIAGDVGQRIRAIDSEGEIVGELKITSYSQSTIVVGDVKYAFSAPTYSGGSWGVSVESISGLDHLEAATVSVLGDGGTDKPSKVVSDGTITLAYDYFYITVGLPYDQIIKTLPQEAGSQRGTSQGKIQRISEVAFKVNRSHKGFKVGGSASSTDEIRYAEDIVPDVVYTGTIPNADFILKRVSFRDPTTLLGTPELLYTGTIPNITFRNDYAYGSQVYILNEDPLPVELLSLITTLDTQDK